MWSYRKSGFRKRCNKSPKNARVCSEYFIGNDYVVDMQDTLSKINGKLKESSVPVVNLPFRQTKKREKF